MQAKQEKATVAGQDQSLRSILNLIDSSRENDATKAEILVELFSANPALRNLTFLPLERTILHILVLKNKPQIISRLLNMEQFKKLAVVGDRTGQTSLHYAARQDETFQECLDLLIELVPNLLNVANKSGNTPLHEAVRSKQLWAIRTLVKSADKTIENKDQKTPLELAENNSEVISALMHLDLEQANSLNRIRAKQRVVESDFARQFPLLSAKRKEKLSLESMERRSPSNSPKLLTWEEALRETHKGLNGNDKKLLSSFENIEQLFKRLFYEYQQDKNSFEYKELLTLFCKLCNEWNLVPNDALSNLVHSLPECLSCLYDILQQLFLEIKEEHSAFTMRNEEISTELRILLFKQGLNNISEPGKKPDFAAIAIQQQLLLEIDDVSRRVEILETIWRITACENQHDEKGEIDFLKLSRRAFGLQNFLSFDKIINLLTELHPHFTQHQKLVANYLVLELINLNVAASFKLEKTTVNHLNLFLARYIPESEETSFANEVRKRFTRLIRRCQNFCLQPVWCNYQLIQEWTRHSNLSHSLLSFDQLINNALTKRSTDWQHEVTLVTHELKTLSRIFFEQVEISEFANGNWLKDQSKAPHIVVFTNYFNSLNNYFLSKILNLPRKKLLHGVKFLIHLSRELGHLEGENYPDLQHLMMIHSVLNNKSLDRLVSFKKLPKREFQLMQELEKLLDARKNWKWMRSVYRNNQTALPFIPALLGEFTFAREQSHLLIQAEMAGKILFSFLEVKQLNNLALNRFYSNLPQFLQAYISVSEDELYGISLRLCPRKTDVIILPKEESLESILDKLEDGLAEGIILTVKVQETAYSPSQLLQKLIAYFSHQVQHADILSAEKISQLKNQIEQLESIIPKFVTVNNNYYCQQPAHNEMNLFYFKNVVIQLKKQLLDSSRKNANTPTKTHRSSFFLESNDAVVQSATELKLPKSHSSECVGSRIDQGEKKLSSKLKDEPVLTLSKQAFAEHQVLETDLLLSKNKGNEKGTRGKLSLRLHRKSLDSFFFSKVDAISEDKQSLSVRKKGSPNI
ncbi:ankyrin repeat domain-containing protein [Legionella clemsonensis]|uniref:RasGEF domain protein n=1 Tax=Legionella clemsonensis TaxID=1867846 RepID=A0A222P2R5_9GAMM|nr:ankyrin repeat domain-containing protein [Legionella clemsonensis]ASQ46154.1 RasGEF domain protein [Legionella clemsonensis]